MAWRIAPQCSLSLDEKLPATAIPLLPVLQFSQHEAVKNVRRAAAARACIFSMHAQQVDPTCAAAALVRSLPQAGSIICGLRFSLVLCRFRRTTGS